MNWKKLVEEILEHFRMSNNELALKIEVTPSTIGNILHGKVVTPRKSMVRNLENKLGILIDDVNSTFQVVEGIKNNFKSKRPSWDKYFLKLAMLASERATCPRMHCGCVFVRDKFVLATGYNGSLPGQPHCEDVGCLVVDNHCVRTNHAEINALTQAATHGINLKGATAYITNMSCTTCAKALIAAGIKRVVVFSDFHDTLATEFYTKSGVEIAKLDMPDRLINYDLENYTSAKKTGNSK